MDGDVLSDTAAEDIAEDTGSWEAMGPACSSVNDDADFGRDDIVFCDTDGWTQLRDALDVCEPGWHVCGDDEFIARNSLFSAVDNGIYLGVMDSGHNDLSVDDCAMYHRSNEVGAGGHHGSVDSIAGSNDHGYLGGTCDTSLPTPHADDFNYADTYAADPDMNFSGRQSGVLVKDAPDVQFGVLCCN